MVEAFIIDAVKRKRDEQARRREERPALNVPVGDETPASEDEPEKAPPPVIIDLVQ